MKYHDKFWQDLEDMFVMCGIEPPAPGTQFQHCDGASGKLKAKIENLLLVAKAASELCYVSQVSNLLDEQTKDSAISQIKNALEKLK